MTLVAKPIVKNQKWVVTDGQNKVGNVEATSTGFSLKLDGKQAFFDNTQAIEKVAAIEFQRPEKSSVKKHIHYARWPVAGKTYNDMFDVKRRLHVYTKVKNSRCYYAAGWFRVKMTEDWQTIFCPKYIFITRYPYSGPYMTSNDAEVG